MLNYEELMRKIDALEMVVKDLSQTIEQVSKQSSSELNPTADLCQNIYEDIIKHDPISKDTPIKHLKGMLVAEFYKKQCAHMLTATDFELFYQTCKSEINTQFELHPDKARFLQLMMMLQLISKSQTAITKDHIAAAFKLFQTELDKPKAKTEFEVFFAQGAMIGFNSLEQFLKSIESYLSPIASQTATKPRKYN